MDITFANSQYPVGVLLSSKMIISPTCLPNTICLRVVAKAVNEARTAPMEATALVKGLYLKPFKTGLGLYLKPYPGYDWKKIKLKIPNSRGIFMSNESPADGSVNNESAVVNLDNAKGIWTNWVCYTKVGKKVWYFNSFKDYQPPPDLMRYLKVPEVMYNHQRYQAFGTQWCGHLCLKFFCGVI